MFLRFTREQLYEIMEIAHNDEKENEVAMVMLDPLVYSCGKEAYEKSNGNIEKFGELYMKAMSIKAGEIASIQYKKVL